MDIILDDGLAVVAEQILLRQARARDELRAAQQRVVGCTKLLGRANQARLELAEMLANQKGLPEGSYDIEVQADKAIHLVAREEEKP